MLRSTFKSDLNYVIVVATRILWEFQIFIGGGVFEENLIIDHILSLTLSRIFNTESLQGNDWV